MKRVKIISGAYGHRNKTRLEVKTRQSAPFALDDIEAERLVGLGVAEIVGEATDGIVEDDLGDNPSNNPTPTENGAENAQDGDNGDEGEMPEYSLESSSAELRAIAERYNITFKPTATKKEMVSALDSYFADEGEE